MSRYASLAAETTIATFNENNLLEEYPIPEIRTPFQQLPLG